uniref:SH2 domain-containing protein n=2 Tax=Ciona intestinalis TaxID=7719 RepID=F6S7G7_CIOIN
MRNNKFMMFQQPPINKDTIKSKVIPPFRTEPKPTEKSNNIKDQPWFRDVDRASATVSVERDGREGCFIVRPGRDCRKTPYSLTVYSNHKTYNLQIALRSESTYAIGTEKPNEQTFNNVVELISFFMKSSLKLAEGEGNVTLRGPP